MLSPTDLPDDVDALKAMIVAKQDRIGRLEGLIAAFRQVMFGRKSERLDPDQLELAFEDVETGIAAVDAEVGTNKTLDAAPTLRPRKINRGALPRDLPRIEEVIGPSDTICACGRKRHVIGEDVSEQLDMIPAQFRVIGTRRPKYACRSCEDGVAQAPAPARLIQSGIPTEATVAHVLVSKYADHLPLYRQAQIYSRRGIDLDRSTLAAWVGKAAFELRPVFEALIAELKRSTKLFMDETRAPVLDPGKRKTKTGYFWALARDDRPWGGDDPPGVAFTYAPGRSGEHGEKILENFAGILQVDGYAGYNRLVRPDRAGKIQLAFCWAHARRKLHEIAKDSTAPIAEEGLKRIAELYRIEANIHGRSPGERLAARQERSAPKIAAFKAWLTEQRARVSSKSPLGEALKYIARLWDGLCRFLTDGRIEMDSNAVERADDPTDCPEPQERALRRSRRRCPELGRHRVINRTCKLNNVEPYAYLTATLQAIVGGHKQSRIADLLPWHHGAGTLGVD